MLTNVHATYVRLISCIIEPISKDVVSILTSYMRWSKFILLTERGKVVTLVYIKLGNYILMLFSYIVKRWLVEKVVCFIVICLKCHITSTCSLRSQCTSSQMWMMVWMFSDIFESNTIHHICMACHTNLHLYGGWAGNRCLCVQLASFDRRN